MSGRNPPFIVYTYINRHAGTPKAETKSTMSLGTAEFRYVGYRVGWVSALRGLLSGSSIMGESKSIVGYTDTHMGP